MQRINLACCAFTDNWGLTDAGVWDCGIGVSVKRQMELVSSAGVSHGRSTELQEE